MVEVDLSAGCHLPTHLFDHFLLPRQEGSMTRTAQWASSVSSIKGHKGFVALWSSTTHLASGFDSCVCQVAVEPLGKAFYIHLLHPLMCKTSTQL